MDRVKKVWQFGFKSFLTLRRMMLLYSFQYFYFQPVAYSGSGLANGRVFASYSMQGLLVFWEEKLLLISLKPWYHWVENSSGKAERSQKGWTADTGLPEWTWDKGYAANYSPLPVGIRSAHERTCVRNQLIGLLVETLRSTDNNLFAGTLSMWKVTYLLYLNMWK